MNNRPESDEEIAARERQRARMWSRKTLWSLLFWIACALLLVLAFNFNVPQRLGAKLGLPEALVIWFPMILLVVVWIIFMIYRVRFAPTPGAMRPGVQRRLVDDITRRQRWLIAVFIPLTLILALNQRAPHGPGDWYGPSIFVGYMLLAALMLVLGPGFLNRRYRAANADEMSRALRGRATGIGYVVAMAALSALYLAHLFAPQAQGLAILLAMSATFIVPALYYIIADWRAGHDG